MKKTILITGSAGFIGRNLSESLAPEYDLLLPTSHELNLLNSEQVKQFLTSHKFATVIHCATHDASRNSKKDQREILSNNLRMFFNLARCNTSYGRMFYFGSGAEYDKAHYVPRMAESYFDTFVPEDDYGFSKYIMAKHIESTLNIYDLRIFGCFGKYEDWEIRFISNAICKTMLDLDITLRQNMYFDYLYIDDLVAIVRRLVEQKILQYKHYNVCSGNPVALLSLAKKILKRSGENLAIKIGAPGLKPEYTGDNTRLLSEIGGFQFTQIDKSIDQLYDWYEGHRSRIDKKLLLTDK